MALVFLPGEAERHIACELPQGEGGIGQREETARVLVGPAACPSASRRREGRRRSPRARARPCARPRASFTTSCQGVQGSFCCLSFMRNQVSCCPAVLPFAEIIARKARKAKLFTPRIDVVFFQWSTLPNTVLVRKPRLLHSRFEKGCSCDSQHDGQAKQEDRVTCHYLRNRIRFVLVP